MQLWAGGKRTRHTAVRRVGTESASLKRTRVPASGGAPGSACTLPPLAWNRGHQNPLAPQVSVVVGTWVGRKVLERGRVHRRLQESLPHPGSVGLPPLLAVCGFERAQGRERAAEASAVKINLVKAAPPRRIVTMLGPHFTDEETRRRELSDWPQRGKDCQQEACDCSPPG